MSPRGTRVQTIRSWGTRKQEQLCPTLRTQTVVLLVGLILGLFMVIVQFHLMDQSTLSNVENDLSPSNSSISNGPREGRTGDTKSIAIPPTVYQSWISRDMAPGMKANFNKWRTMNGDDYEFVFFDDEEQRAWMEKNCTAYWPAWNENQLPASRADLFRYCLLYVNGGIWSDIDVVPKRPLREFVNSSIKLVVVHDGGMSGDQFLYNAFLAAAPAHPALKRAMDIVMEHYQVRLRRGAVWCTGPNVLWRAINDTLMGRVRPKSFVGIDEEHMLEYLHFRPNSIVGAGKGEVLSAKYVGYLKDATMHGGEPHYGREVTWSTKVTS